MNFKNWVISLIAFCCLSAATARAVGPEVRDNGGLFSTAAIKQADETIRSIQREFRKDLLVETFASVPENRKDDYSRGREEFFAGLVRERAQAARLDGIYVLIMKEPPPHHLRVQVGVGQATRRRAFLAGDRDQLVKLFQTNFREEKYDEGLRAGVAFVEQTLRSNLGNQSSLGSTSKSVAPIREPASRNSSASRDSGWGLLTLGLFIVGGILVVSFLMRLLRGGLGGGGVPGPGGMMSSGGGGFFSSLLAGIGGAMAGNWLYDRFFGNHHDSGDTWASSAADAPASDVGGDFASSGGDVDSGSSFGSSDFDGGTDSGGDFGGGGDA
ncbi:MAG: TPM domain-containing protein [Verrucomicrobia bacterium]|nr:TPM domain-containing protein [Verrucomicrobiota bacterium]